MTKPDSMPPPFDEPHTGARFRTTHWSLIVCAGQDDTVAARQALGELCCNYWYPLYAFVRRQGYAPADAEDLTQSFLAKLLKKNYLANVRREKGKFRSFLPGYRLWCLLCFFMRGVLRGLLFSGTPYFSPCWPASA